jgi:hypothetical protein
MRSPCHLVDVCSIYSTWSPILAVIELDTELSHNFRLEEFDVHRKCMYLDSRQPSCIKKHTIILPSQMCICPLLLRSVVKSAFPVLLIKVLTVKTYIKFIDIQGLIKNIRDRIYCRKMKAFTSYSKLSPSKYDPPDCMQQFQQSFHFSVHVW